MTSTTPNTKQELREKITDYLLNTLEAYGVDTSDEYYDAPDEEYVDGLVQLLSDTVNKVLDEVTREMEQKEKRSGQGSRPEYSRRNETKGEWHSRIQGFKSGCLSAVSAIERVRKEWL